MNSVKAILFDLDGVLIDSLVAKWTATEHALKEHGVSPDRQTMAPYMHKLRAVQENLAQHAPYDSMLQSYRAKLEELRHTIGLYEGTREVLEGLRDKGFILGAVSSSDFAQQTVEQLGLSDLFEVVVSGLDTKVFKPHPEPILLTLQKLHLQPNQAVIVGDLPADIQAGKAAGLAVTIGITHGFGTEGMLRKADADHVISTLQAIPATLEKFEAS